MPLLASRCRKLATPAILHALADAEHIPVPVIGGEEAPACLAARKAREFSKLMDGGFSSHQARAVQRSLWYHVYVFMSSTRRTGHPLKNASQTQFDNPDIVNFIAPHARTSDADEDASSGDDDMVVQETPVRGPDVIIDGFEELEDFLQNLE